MQQKKLQIVLPETKPSKKQRKTKVRYKLKQK